MFKKRSPKRNQSKAKSLKSNGKRKKSFLKTTKFKVILLSSIMLVSVLSVILVGMGTLLGKINFEDRNIFNRVDSVGDDVDDPNASFIDLEVDFPEGEFMSNKNVMNILLIGSDSRGETYGRSDSMIVVSIDKKNKKLKMTSFLRDLYVKIPGQDSNRINASYAWGGPALLIDTIEQNFGIKIDNYIRTDFRSFESMVDILGGVNMDVTQGEIDLIEYYGGAKGFTPGIVHLDGKSALAYSRIRYIGSDFARVQRQRNVLNALIAKFKSSSPTKMYGFLNDSLDYFYTDMKEKDLQLLAKDSIKIMNYDIEQLSIPLTDGYTSQTIRQMSVLVPDIQRNMLAVQNFIYE